MRVAHGQRVAEEASTVSPRSGASVVEAIREAAAASRFVPDTEGFAGFADGGDPLEEVPRYESATASATAEERVAHLAPAMEAIRAAGLVSAGALETSSHALAVATTRGCARTHQGTIAGFKVWALGNAWRRGSLGLRRPATCTATRLRASGSPKRPSTRIRIAPDVAAPFVARRRDVRRRHGACRLQRAREWLATIAFGAAEVENGTSPFAGRLGERITGADVSLTEDPNDPGEHGFSAPFDREGTARRRVTLLEDGIARGVLYDRTYAARAKTRSTGSALPGTSIGPSAIHVAGGDAASVDALLAGVERGLYVCRLHYVNGLLEPRRAMMTGLTRDGCFLVEKGKVTRPVGNLRFTDSLL